MCQNHPKHKPSKKPKHNCDQCLNNYLILSINKPRFIKQTKVIKSKKHKEKYKNYEMD